MARRLQLVALVFLLIGGTSLQADWIVTKDGQKIETRGPWKVKGKMVVFTLPNGTFSSLRVDTVDLDASQNVEKELEEAERKAKEQAEAEKQPAKPALELTDADLPRRYSAPDEDDDETDPEEEVATPEPAGPTITVSGWQKLEDGDGGFELVGTFRNSSSKMATDIEVTVMLFDAEGVIVDAVGANLTSASLGPDEQGQFNAIFDSPREFASMKFDVSSFDIEGEEE